MASLFSLRPARLAGAALAASLTAACAGMPPAPLKANPATETGTDFLALPGDAAPSANWWTGFDDPELQRLVETALGASPVLRGADYSVAETEALLRLALLGRSPSLSSSARASADRRLNEDAFETTGNLNLAANWELDVFGRLGGAVAAARFDEAAARELRRDLAVTVASETALAYIDLRSGEARLAVARQNAEAQKESLDLVRTLFENGRANELDLTRSETQYRTTLASLPAFKATITAARSRLAALTGSSASLASSLANTDPATAGRIPSLTTPLAAGTPEEMLRRRPDVRLAEARIGSALALGRSARANLFPRVTLGANVLSLFSETGVAFSDETVSLSFGPAINWAGPDLRRVYAQIDLNDARTLGAAADYEAAVLDALAETETALSAYVTERQRRADLDAAFVSARRAYDLARLRYEEGLDSFLDVLDAQRTLLDAEDRLAVNEAEIARRAIRAYRTLGGIWTDEELAAFRAEQEENP